MGRYAIAIFVLLAVPATALAQDFGTEWIDRVTHERYYDKGPVRPKPVDVTFSGGAAVYHDDNLFLAEDDEEKDTVFIPFVGARLDYVGPKFDAVVDFLGNYKMYSDNDELNDYEQRFFGRVRYVGPRGSIELVQLFRHESDPFGVPTSFERSDRVVSDTQPKFTYDFTRTLALEGTANLEVVRFDEPAFQTIENENYRVDGALVYRMANGYDFLVQGGWMLIDYKEDQSDGGAPDADGGYGRVGFRGELSQRLWVEAQVGVIHIESRTFIGTDRTEDDTTLDAIVRLKWEAAERFTLQADYVRTFGFAGTSGAAPDPYQFINRGVLLAEYEATQELKFRARFQIDVTETSLGLERMYMAVGGGASYRIVEWLSIDAGLTFRTGEVSGDVVSDVEFDNLIFHGGVVLSY